MALSSVISIDLDDARFARFKRLFDAYQEALAKQPKLWAATGTAQTALQRNFASMTTALMAQNQLLHRTTSETDKQERSTTQIAKMWTSIAGSTRSALGSIVSIGESLLKWSGIAGLFTGLLGGGLAAFGFDRLLRGATGDRRAAIGLGISFGGLRGFDTNMSRLLDPTAYLSWINQMEQDVTAQRPAFSLLGHALTGNTSADAVSMLMAARGLAQRTPLSMLGPAFAARGLDFDPETRMRLRTMGAGEFGQLLTATGRDSRSMNVADPVLLKWQNFMTQIERAGNQISKVFIDGLTPLIGPLGKLSASFEKFLATLLKSDLVKEGIQNLGNWLNNFSGEIGGTEFLDKIKQFGSDIGDLADLIHDVTHPGETVQRWNNISRGWDVRAMDWLSDTVHPSGGIKNNIANYLQYLGGLDRRFGLPAGTMERIKLIESGMSLDPNITNKKSGATGPMGFMPKTAEHYGINPNDLQQAAYGAAMYMQDLLGKYNGDMSKALAAYNGVRGLDAMFLAHPQDWQKYAKTEAAGYRNFGNITITILDATGGSAHVSVNGLSSGSP